MSRGKLDKESAVKIENGLPNIIDLKKSTFAFQPDFLSFAFPQGSRVPIAAVCLQDLACTLLEVRYALFEAFAHIVWYREKSQPANEALAVFFGRFYADDAALRLYTAREHLTEAIVCMLEIRKEHFRRYEQLATQRMAKLSTLAMGLERDSPGDQVAKIIDRLLQSDMWRKTIDYRNKWVHDKPPILKGTGIGYERRNRLLVSVNSIGVTFGGGDEPQYSVDDLLDFLRPALLLFAETTAALISFYGELINSKQHVIELTE